MSLVNRLLVVVGLAIVTTLSAAGAAQAKPAPFDEPPAPGRTPVSGSSGWDGWMVAAATVGGTLLVLGLFLAIGTVLRRTARHPAPSA